MPESQILVLNRAKSREVDRRAINDYGMTGLMLMENAGRSLAELLLQLQLPDPFVIVCGKGNNAGDGFVIARHLDNALKRVRLLLTCDPAEFHGDALVNWRIVHRSGLSWQRLDAHLKDDEVDARLQSAGCLLDAMLGTGAVGSPRPPIDRWIEAMNRAGKPIVAVDLPSGLDCDTGQPSNCTIRAAHTGTFVAQKPGFLTPEATPFLGAVHVLSIGAPRRLLEELQQVIT